MSDAQAFHTATQGREAPLYEVTLWPHRSLPRKGFSLMIWATCAMFLIPLMAFVGSPILWGLLAPIVITLGGLWYFFERNYKDGSVQEQLCLWPDLITVERRNPRSENQYWYANPHWVRINMRKTKEVENYLTLSGGNREIELGAFLAPEERERLRDVLAKELGALRA